MNIIAYTARPSIATVDTTYAVSADDLTWSAGSEQQRMRLAEVESVRLFAAPSAKFRFMANASMGGLEMFNVKARDGRSLSISSKHYQSLGVFEDRSTTFAPFVDAVITRVAMVNPTAVFREGMPPGVWWLWVGVAAVMGIAMIFGMLMIIGSATGAGTLVGLLGGLVFTIGTGMSLRSALATVRNGRQRTFDPRIGQSPG